MEKLFAISLNPQIVFYSFVSYFVSQGATDQKRVFCFLHENTSNMRCAFCWLDRFIRCKKVNKTGELHPS